MKKVKLFGRDVEFFWGERDTKFITGPKPIEIWPYFLIVSFFLFFSISDAYDSSKGIMSIPVVTSAGQFSAPREFALTAGNAFVSGGGSGTLTWHPQSLLQALILKMSDTTNLNFMDIFHVGLLYLFVLVFYWMTRKGKGKMVFSERVSQGFRIIFLFIAISGALEYGKYKMVDRYVEHITNGQFSLPEATIQWYYFYLGIMLIVISRFTDRVNEQQQERTLTI